MTQPEARVEFDHYTAELIETCEGHPLITGLVLMGSTADRMRVDEWSDHDFAVVVAAGDEETLRNDLSWLPRSASIVSTAREHHDGFKVIYRDGSVIEFGVTNADDLAGWHVNAWEVAYGDDELRATMQAVAARVKPLDAVDPERDLAVFLTALLVGVGRARRGEVLSGSASVRGLALDHLLVLLRELVPATGSEQLDDLDQRRRFELVHPGLGRELGLALELPVEECARDLLRVAEEQLSGWPGFPVDAVDVVRQRLAW